MSQRFQDILTSRRAFLAGAASLPLLQSCATAAHTDANITQLSFASVPASNADTISLPPGYRWQKLIAWGDALFDNAAPFDPASLTRAEQEKRFGSHNDMLALFPARYAFPWPTDQSDLILCANNEYSELDLMFPGVTDFTPAHVETALAAIGISVVRLRQRNGAWAVRTEPQASNATNRRITPFSPVVFSGPAAQHRWITSAGARVNAAEPARAPAPVEAIRCGTLANCAGGRTPWGTYLSSEENFDVVFSLSDANTSDITAARADTAWLYDAGKFGYPLYTNKGDSQSPRQFDVAQNPYGPSLYGWVLEVDPYDPSWTPRKRTALGRKKGECATTAIAKDNRVAVYMGDDQIDHFVFKFVTDGRFNATDRIANRDLLDHGTLYAARFDEDGAGEWLALTVEACNAAVEEAPYHARFADLGDVVVRAREAALLLGATQMDRPEDVEAPVDANWRGLGSVFVVCTNNRNDSFNRPGNPRRGEAQNAPTQQANLAGHILRIDENDSDHAAMHFRWDVFALAGDPQHETIMLPNGAPCDVSVKIANAPTFTGARFTCPDNLCFDSVGNLWIATDGSPSVFADCNDSVLAVSTKAEAPREVKRFLVGPVGAEICGPTFAPDERAFLCAIQHPGEANSTGVNWSELRHQQGARPPSNFPDGGDSWPRSTVVVVTRDDGGKIGL